LWFIYQVFEGLHSQGQQAEVRDWVLLSLGSFIQRFVVFLVALINFARNVGTENKVLGKSELPISVTLVCSFRLSSALKDFELAQNEYELKH